MLKIYVSNLHVSTLGTDPFGAQRSWKQRHNEAVSAYLAFRADHSTHLSPPASEAGILALVDGLAFYVGRLGQGLAEWPDGVLTPAVGSIIEGIRTLLNGDCGRLDCGTVDALLCNAAEAVGWDLDTSEIVWDADADAGREGFVECQRPRGMLQFVTDAEPYYVTLHGRKTDTPRRVVAISSATRRVSLEGRQGYVSVDRIAATYHRASC